MSCLERHYPSGALYARIQDEKHEYFYENGTPKTIEHYTEGRLHGEAILYWPNGALKRKCQFHQGKRFGLDQMWNDEGKLLDEQDYGSL